MKLFECFRDSGFHTCIATTFDLNFEAFEAMALTRLRDARCNNNVVVADSRMVTLALQRGSGLPKHAGKRYSVVDAQLSGAGVYHPKIILQLGRKTGRLIVGSANLTAPGLAGNLEIVGEVKVSEGELSGVPLLRAAMSYVVRTMDPTAQTARQQVEWALARSPWLRNGLDSIEPVADGEGGLTAFLAHESGLGIGARFTALIGDEKVRRLVIASPYWDPDLSALKWLNDRLKPTKTKVLLQTRSRLFPVGAVGRRSKFEFHELSGLRRVQSRFVHAKLIIAQTKVADHVLYGSSNCTTAALGHQAFGGSNEEASLYRRMKPGQAVESLQLEQAVGDETLVALEDIPEFAITNEIPLKETQLNLPGRFEIRAGVLLWWPKPKFDNDDARVDLYDVSMKLLGAGLTSTPSPVMRRIAFPVGEIPSFACVRLDASVSGFSLITVDEAIYEAQRRVKSPKIRNALEFLQDEEASEGLWLLEIIDDVHRAEVEDIDDTQERSPARKSHHRSRTPTAVERTTLSYEDFIKGRQMVRSAGEGESTLAASYIDAIRSALNFFSGQGKKSKLPDDEEVPSPTSIFNMGDETSDGEEEIEAGQEPEPLPVLPSSSEEAARKRAIERRRRYYRDTPERIRKAVVDFLDNARSKASTEDLTSLDLLRLRAFLMVVLTAGTSGANVVAPPLDRPMSRVQVLPIQGESGWPRLSMQLLYEFFRRRPPLALKTRLPDIRDGALPVDIAECWATCYWAVCAVQTATDNRGVPFVASNTAALATQVYATIGLSQVEASSGVIASTMQYLSTRLALRLGVDAPRLWTEHLSSAAIASKSNPS